MVIARTQALFAAAWQEACRTRIGYCRELLSSVAKGSVSILGSLRGTRRLLQGSDPGYLYRDSCEDSEPCTERKKVRRPLHLRSGTGNKPLGWPISLRLESRASASCSLPSLLLFIFSCSRHLLCHRSRFLVYFWSIRSPIFQAFSLLFRLVFHQHRVVYCVIPLLVVEF